MIYCKITKSPSICNFETKMFQRNDKMQLPCKLKYPHSSLRKLIFFMDMKFVFFIWCDCQHNFFPQLDFLFLLFTCYLKKTEISQKRCSCRSHVMVPRVCSLTADVCLNVCHEEKESYIKIAFVTYNVLGGGILTLCKHFTRRTKRVYVHGHGPFLRTLRLRAESFRNSSFLGFK